MRTTIVLLAASLVLVATPVVAANEAEADCEPGQPWIGYTTSASAQALYEGLGRPGGLYVCEGEHWDGQDQVGSGDAGNDLGSGCAGTDGTSVYVCMTDTESKDGQGTSPVGVRTSNAGTEHYVGANLPIGYATLYVDENGVVGVYLRDNTPGNPLAQVVSAAGLTKGFPSESDCTQSEYQAGAMANDRTKCGRDNTAITIYILK